MTRHHIRFSCKGDTLVGTLDESDGSTGLLIVTGGNETRAGAFSGQARLAARIAASGYPVFRFDRRGVGDSTGDNKGFRCSAPDIAAALAEWKRVNPQLRHIVGFGNCDAASALMLAGGAACDALVLSNPWTFDSDEAPPPPDAIRARYLDKLTNPRELLRLATGNVSLPKLAAGMRRALAPPPPPAALLQQMRSGLADYAGEVRFLLAGRDRTAQAFAAGWDSDDPRLITCPGADHAFSGSAAQDWLFRQIIAALEGE